MTTFDFIAVLIVAVGNLVLGLLVLNKNREAPLNRFFGLFTLFIGLWIATAFLADNQQTVALQIVYSRITFAMVILASYYLARFTSEFFNYPLGRIDNKLLLTTTAILYLYAGVTIFSPLLVIGATPQAYGFDVVYSDLGSLIFNIYVGGAIIYFLTSFIIRFRKSTGITRAQYIYFGLGLALTLTVNLLVNIVFKAVTGSDRFYRFGNYSFILFTGLTAYSILAHRLFDIKVIIKKTLVYSGLLLFAVMTYGMIILFFAALFGGGSNEVFDIKNFAVNITAMGIVAVGFEPLRHWLVRVTDKYLFVGEYDAQSVTADLAQKLSGVLDLDEALQTMMKSLTKALRVKKAAAFIIATDKEHGLAVKRVESVGYGSAVPKIESTSPLISHFERPDRDVVVTEELLAALDGHAQQAIKCQPLVDQLNVLGSAVALPIRVNEKLIGILAVGPRLSGAIFSVDDLQFLSVAATQTASAIEKSRFYEDDQMKSEFVSIASHELLTPTAAIEGYLSMILDEHMAHVDKKAEAYLRKVQVSAKRLSELVTDLLSVSRIESGRIVVNKQAIDPIPVTLASIDEIKVRADAADIKLAYTQPTGKIPKVLADPERLTQILINLISNAIKYNKPKGTITVSITSDKRFVTFAVQDTGIGIAPEHIPHLFEKFYRVHDDSAAAEKIGTGLGLYITRSIIELQGGKIMVKSDAGKGSNFSFTLPVA